MNLPFYKQINHKDCGPTCLKIIVKHYGKTVNIQVNVCKDCEYRYICLSYVEKEKKILDKPSACTYDPYEAKWSTIIKKAQK